MSMQAALLTLQHENGHLADKVQTADTDKDAAVSTHVAYLQDDICALIDERDELQVRGRASRFLGLRVWEADLCSGFEGIGGYQ